MERIKQETQFKLTKDQLQNAITGYINEGDCINDLFTMVINSLMYVERSNYLSENQVDGNKGNGYRELLKAGIGSGLELKVPRDRLGLFKPILLGVLEQQEEKIKELSFALYGKGLTTRQISDVLESIYGTNYSKSSISRITTSFSSHVKSWLNRQLDEFYPVVFIDAIHLKVKRDTVSTEAFYVVLGLKKDFTREVLSIINLPTESSTGWYDALLEIKERGVKKVGLFVFDDLKSLDMSIGKVFKNSLQQKCILHFQRNLSKKIRVKDRAGFCEDIKQVFDPDNKTYTTEQATKNLKNILQKWESYYPSLTRVRHREELELLFTYLKFDYRIRRMIYTTNWIERLNKSFKRTTKIRNALPSPDSALTLLGYVAIEMEEKTYKYPITNFKFDSTFNRWSDESEQWKTF